MASFHIGIEHPGLNLVALLPKLITTFSSKVGIINLPCTISSCVCLKNRERKKEKTKKKENLAATSPDVNYMFLECFFFFPNESKIIREEKGKQINFSDPPWGVRTCKTVSYKINFFLRGRGRQQFPRENPFLFSI